MAPSTVSIDDLDELEPGQYFDFQGTRWECISEGEWRATWSDGTERYWTRDEFLEEYCQ